MRTSILLGVLVAATTLAAGQSGEQAAFQDPLLEHMTGSWSLTGKVLGQEAHHQVTVEWVLGHRFLRIHEKTTADAPQGEQPYEATVFVGDDPVSERYVVHWLDLYGGRFSETLGYGTRDGDAIKLVFEYPDGPFHTTFRWLPESGTWQWLMETRNKEGKWVQFADFRLTRSEPKHAVGK